MDSIEISQMISNKKVTVILELRKYSENDYNKDFSDFVNYQTRKGKFKKPEDKENITPIGASANIVAMGIATKEGYKTRFIDFVRMGVPFTLFAVVGAASQIFFFYL